MKFDEYFLSLTLKVYNIVRAIYRLGAAYPMLNPDNPRGDAVLITRCIIRIKIPESRQKKWPITPSRQVLVGLHEYTVIEIANIWTRFVHFFLQITDR